MKTLNYYLFTYKKITPKKIQTDNIKMSSDNRHLIINDTLKLKIEFWGNTFHASSKEEDIKIWNDNCGDVRGKRYNKLDRLKTLDEKLDYIKMQMDRNAGYLKIYVTGAK